jgi:hypothetical protein
MAAAMNIPAMISAASEWLWMLTLAPPLVTEVPGGGTAPAAEVLDRASMLTWEQPATSSSTTTRNLMRAF